MQELLVILNYTTGKVIIINAPTFEDNNTDDNDINNEDFDGYIDLNYKNKDYSEYIEEYIAENYPGCECSWMITTNLFVDIN